MLAYMSLNEKLSSKFIFALEASLIGQIFIFWTICQPRTLSADIRAGFGTLPTISSPPYQAPHIRPPISGPLPYQAPHIRPPISSPLPYQAPHIRPPISNPLPYQAPHFKPPTKQHLRPQPTISSPWYSIINTTSWHTISGPDQPYQAPDTLSSIWLHDTPYQAPTNHIKPLIFYRQYDFMTHHIRPRPTISSPWYSILNTTSWHTISGPDQPYQAPNILSSIWLHNTPYQSLTNHIKPLIFSRQHDFMTHQIRPRPTI